MRRTLVLFCTASLMFAVGTKAQTPREVVLTTDNAYNPIPSPNGKYVAYVRTGWGRGFESGFGRGSLVSDVTVTEVDGASTPKLLAKDFFLSGWTPDGTRVVCFRDGRYALVSTDGQQTMTGLIPNDPGRDYDPTEWVAYLPTLATLVWSRRVDESHDAIETPGTPIAQGVASGQRVVPSPDGRYLAVFPQSLRGELRIYDLHSKSWRDLGSMTVHPDKDWSYIQPDWSPWFPDGSRLVFLRDSTLVIDSPDGNTETEISVDRPAGLPVPSPDGDRVAYVTFEPRPMKMRQDLRFWGGTTIWVTSATAGSRPRAATEKNEDEVYDLKWLNNETLVFDRIADEVFYRHARIWKASVPQSLAVSSQDLHNRYGEPDMERFSARPGISVMAQYGSDRLVCEVSIEAAHSLVHPVEQEKLMSSKDVSDVIEEIAPASTRGKEINHGSFQSGCNVGEFTDYENVSILRATHTCDPSSQNQDAHTLITFKRETCPKETPAPIMKK